MIIFVCWLIYLFVYVLTFDLIMFWYYHVGYDIFNLFLISALLFLYLWASGKKYTPRIWVENY